METDAMRLKILLPDRVFLDQREVRRIVVETGRGLFGLLPRRLDCVAPLVPGILIHESATGGENYVAVDAGILVKTGREVFISVRHAVGGRDLAQLHELVQREFVERDEREKQVRSALVKLESGLIRRLAGFHHE